MGRFEEAITNYDRALQYHPRDFSIYYGKGRRYYLFKRECIE